MEISLRTAMIAQAPHVIRKFSMVGCDQSRVSVGAQIFGRIETEGGERADGSGARIAPAGSDRLRGVFHDGHLELVCWLTQGIHVGALTIKMDGQQSAQAGRFSRAQVSL